MAVISHNDATRVQFNSPYNTVSQIMSQTSSKHEYVCRIIHMAPAYDAKSLFVCSVEEG